jgi:hypothetical protein
MELQNSSNNSKRFPSCPRRIHQLSIVALSSSSHQRVWQTIMGGFLFFVDRLGFHPSVEDK